MIEASFLKSLPFSYQVLFLLLLIPTFFVFAQSEHFFLQQTFCFNYIFYLLAFSKFLKLDLLRNKQTLIFLLSLYAEDRRFTHVLALWFCNHGTVCRGSLSFLSLMSLEKKCSLIAYLKLARAKYGAYLLMCQSSY